jgi:hypothetical protein
VVNSDALGSIEQREMDRIRRKMLQAQSHSPSGMSGMHLLNRPDHINTAHGILVHSKSSMSEDSAYHMGDTLIHNTNTNKTSPFMSSASNSSKNSPYTMGDSMVTNNFTLPVASKVLRREKSDELRPDGIMAASTTRSGILDSSSDEDLSNTPSDVDVDVDDSEYYMDTDMTGDLTDKVLQEFDTSPRVSSDSVYEVMPYPSK